MPIHDWTRFDPGIFHDFHHAWVEEIKPALNRGPLPADYYALAQLIASHLGPDVLTLRKPSQAPPPAPSGGAIALAADPPKVRFHSKAESEIYAAKAKSVVIMHRSKHQVIALVEIVSPGNKASERDLKAFVQKARDALAAGVHLLIVDLFPPTRAIRKEFIGLSGKTGTTRSSSLRAIHSPLSRTWRLIFPRHSSSHSTWAERLPICPYSYR